MNRTIKINIPEYLKEEYSKEKHILIKNHYIHLAEDIEQYLKDNDIYALYRSSIPSLTNQVNFFKDYQGWLNFTLLNLISSIGINIDDIKNKEDIYSTLQIARVQLKYNRDTNREYLIKKCIKYASTCNKEYVTTPNAKELYALYIDIGLGLINPSELVDTSYEYYLKNINNSNLSKTLKQNI